jgi:GGDEF domain-containing protein
VQLRTDGQALLRDLGLLALALLGCVLATTLTVGGVSRRLAARIVLPLRQLVELTRELRASRSFERRAAPSPVLELHALAEDFNALLAELQSQQQRIEARHRDLRRSNESLRHASLHDGLTGLPNRSHLFEHLHAVLEGGQRRGDRTALLFIDVERFKQVNDELGHAVGDALLVELARRLRGALRESDFVARHGGDEFLAVLLAAGRGRRGRSLRAAHPRRAGATDAPGRRARAGAGREHRRGPVPRAGRQRRRADPGRRCRDVPRQGPPPALAAPLAAPEGLPGLP